MLKDGRPDRQMQSQHCPHRVPRSLTSSRQTQELFVEEGLAADRGAQSVFCCGCRECRDHQRRGKAQYVLARSCRRCSPDVVKRFVEHDLRPPSC